MDYLTAERAVGELRPWLEEQLEAATESLIEAMDGPEVVKHQAECKFIKKLLNLPEELKEPEEEETDERRGDGRSRFGRLFDPRGRRAESVT